MEKVVDLGPVHVDREGNIVAFTMRRADGGVHYAHNLAPRGEVRVAQRGIDGVEPGIAVGAVHGGVEAGAQRHRVAEVGQAEVRRLGLARSRRRWMPSS